MEQLYQSGSEIHVGDFVAYNGQRGQVMFVVDRLEYSEGYPESYWPKSKYATGFMIEFSNGARLLLDCADEFLELISRKIDR